MIRKDHFKTSKPSSQMNLHHRSTHVIAPKKIYGQAENDWPVEEEYFFEAEDY